MSNALTTVSDIERMAVAVAKSNLFGVKTPEQAMALMLIAQAEGLHPAIAARDYHIINNKPSLKADAMLARFHTAGGKVVWHDYTDTKCSATISHPQGGSVTVDWTIEMAKKIGLTKNPTWGSYPRQMLRARVISEGIRTVYPGVAVGIYTPEEVQDFEPASNGKGQVIEGSYVGSTDPVTGEVNNGPPFFKTATLRGTFATDIMDKLNKAHSADEANLAISQVKDNLDGMAKGDARDVLALESIRNTYKLVLSRFAKTTGGVPVEDGGLTEEELRQWELEKEREAALSDRAPYPAGAAA